MTPATLAALPVELDDDDADGWTCDASDCGADCGADLARCWLCGRPRPRDPMRGPGARRQNLELPGDWNGGTA